MMGVRVNEQKGCIPDLGERTLIPGIDQTISSIESWFGRFPESVTPI